MSAAQQHHQSAAGIRARCAILTLSDTRTKETDTSGQTIATLLAGAGHVVTEYRVCKDDPNEFELVLKEWLKRDDIEVVLTNGGTGISSRDQTVGVIERQLTTVIPGFGELFRMLSWDQIGAAAMLSRAVGGIAGKKLLFAMPGSTKAVDLAMSQLILPELKHLLFELGK